MASRDEQWLELVLDCPAPDQARCLVETVGPFLRDWASAEGGRGHFVPDPEAARMRLYLHAMGPSRDEAALRLLRRRLPDPSIPLRANWGSRTDIHEVQMRGSAAQDLVDDFLVDSTPLVLRLLDAGLQRAGERAERAFELMVAQPLALKAQLFPRLRQLAFPIAFVSYRSHVDGFFVMTRSPEVTKQTFEERYQRVASNAEQSVRRIAAQLAAGSDVSEPLNAWLALLAAYGPRVLAGLRSATLLTNMGSETGSIGDNYDLSVSAFHRSVHADPGFRARAALDPEFNTMRILASLLYLTLHRIGVRLIDRYMLCYTVASAFERVYDVSSTQVVRELASVLAESSVASPDLGPA